MGICFCKVGFVTSVVCLALVVLPGLFWCILTPMLHEVTASNKDGVVKLQAVKLHLAGKATAT